jgi:lipopolysaccharide/colanic/teichoic acid biosynthesis glycosyltransferase
MDNDAATRLSCIRDMYAVPHQLGPFRMRRIADVLIASGLLAIMLPLLLLIALLIKCESAGPIFETKSCIGRGGRRFQILRFRTTRDAQDDTASFSGRWRSPIGEFLHYSRLDVLPELLNVIRGDMSILEPDGRSPSFLD